MQMLYDSEAFIVVHINAAEADTLNRHNEGLPKRDGFEIVDKRANRSIYLDGGWAEAFQLQINAWQVNTPCQDDVETLLGGYTELAYIPLIIH